MITIESQDQFDALKRDKDAVLILFGSVRCAVCKLSSHK